MNNDALIAFSVFQLVFLILDLFILTNTGRNIARKGEYTWFCVLVFTHMVYLVLNNLWTMSEYNLVKFPRSITLIICTISLWTVTLCATSFFMFAVEKLNIKRLRNGIGKWLSFIPTAFSTIMILPSGWTELVFYLDDNGSFIHGSMYLPMMASVSLYLLAIAVVSFVNMFHGKTRLLRNTNATMFFSVLIIIAFVVGDSFLAKASVLPAAIFSVIVGIFITMQVANINSDALTGMNNRSKAEDYLSDRIKNVSEKKPLLLYMGDLNNFKKINDTYGHVIGDEALVLCSKAIKQTIDHYGGFAARFGGDEFLFSWQPEKGTEANPDAIINDINTILKDFSIDKPYKLVITAGYVYCTDPKELLHSYIKEADNMLYKRKKEDNIGR